MGAERYGLWARQMLGADLDLDDAYQYGWSEVVRIEADMRRTADAILPGAPLDEVVAYLDREGEAIEGAEPYIEWLQNLVDGTIDTVDGVHFDVPASIRKVEVVAAAAGLGRGAVLHRPHRRSEPSGALLEPADGPHPLPDVERGVHQLPRGRARPSPPPRHRPAQRRPAVASTRPRC